MNKQERAMARMENRVFPECFQPMKPDFTIEDHGSIMFFRPNNKTAKDWLRLTAPEDANFLSGAMAVEPRYAPGVLDALAAEGFSCADFR